MQPIHKQDAACRCFILAAKSGNGIFNGVQILCTLSEERKPDERPLKP